MFIKSYQIFSIYYVPEKSPLMLISVLQVEKQIWKDSLMVTQLKSGTPGIEILNKTFAL